MLTSRAPHRWSLPAVVFTLALSFALAACGDSSQGPGEATERTSSALFANDLTACNYFVAKGLTNFQAAGIVGNLDQESGMSPTAVQGGGPGRGIAQWSVGGRWDHDANDNATAYASQHGQSVLSLQLQLDFIWYELTTFSGYGLASLKASTNVTDAVVVFQNKFEGCGTCIQTQRIAYAQAVLAQCASAAPYAAEFVSQSFPTASTTMTMVEGQVIPSFIELKNTGTKTWDSNTKIATTQARDRASVFADHTWLSPSRLASVTGTVPPGGTHKFLFDLAAPNTPGTYDEHFGVVQDGVAWFSDPAQGGPADNLLEVKIHVVMRDGGALDAGTAHEAGGALDAGPLHGDAGGGGSTGGGDGGDGVAPSTDGTAGCSIGAARTDASSWAGALFAMLTAGGLVRRRRAR